MKIVVIGTACWTFEKFRGSLLRKLVLQGNEVIAIGTNRDQASLKFLESIGVSYYDINFDKGRTDVFSFLFSLCKILKIFSKCKPDVCLAYFLKPIVVATFAKLFYPFRLISLIEGLGHTFTGSRHTLLRKFVKFFLQIILRFSDKVVCLNTMDKEELFQGKDSGSLEKVLVLPGIGVDLNHYELSAMPKSEINFLFLSRLLKAKGLYEFIEAAVKMKERESNASFSVYGQADDSIHGVDPKFIDEMDKKRVIDYGGVVHDVRKVIKSANVLVLPTYYREGLPRCIQEAMAMGRPVITTDFAGCSEIIKDRINGFIVPSKNVSSLIEIMEWFCSNAEKFPTLASDCRKTAEKYFDCNKPDKILSQIILGND